MSKNITTEFCCDRCGKKQIIVIAGNYPKDWVKAELVLLNFTTLNYDLCQDCNPMHGSINDVDEKRKTILDWFCKMPLSKKVIK